MKTLLYIIAAVLMVSCDKQTGEMRQGTVKVNVCFEVEGSKSADPASEEAVSNVNLLVYGTGGVLEDHIYIDRRNYTGTVSLNLLEGAKYDIAACLNFGYKIKAPGMRSGLEELEYYIVYPDDYKEGLPMAALEEGFRAASDQKQLSLKAVRLMSKVALSIDRSALSPGVSFTIEEVRLKNCPRKVSPFAQGAAAGAGDVLTEAFLKKNAAVTALNTVNSQGMSGEVNLYMMENLGGRREDATPSQSPYIELHINYNSPTLFAYAGDGLIYRFYIGGGTDNLNVRRNNSYRFTVCPRGSGLETDNSWSVDKSNLGSY